jgi:hypothetical protein
MLLSHHASVCRLLDKATEESTGDIHTLMQLIDSDVQDKIKKQQRSTSTELLKQELEKHGKVGSRDYLTKVNTAMAVLHARQVLTTLLVHWPETGQVITAGLLGCQDVHQIPCVLDLLNKSESPERFQKVRLISQQVREFREVPEGKDEGGVGGR